MAKTYKVGTNCSHPSVPRLPPKKNTSSKAFAEISDELDDFLFKVENECILNRACYPMDLDKIYYAARWLEMQVAKW